MEYNIFVFVVLTAILLALNHLDIFLSSLLISSNSCVKSFPALSAEVSSANKNV